MQAAPPKHRSSRRPGASVAPVGVDLDPVLRDFATAAERLDLPGWPAALDAEHLPAPHAPRALRPNHGAVYVFALADHHVAEAGAGRILKVGRVGPNSNARFQSQHYSATSARSSLARSLIGYPALWPWLGIDNLDASTVREWMLSNLNRSNVYVPAGSAALIPHLEMYLRARLGGSVYEGSAG